MHEYEGRNNLSERNRVLFVNKLVDLMIEKSCVHPSREVKEAFGLAAIKLFPCFEVSPSNISGMVRIFQRLIFPIRFSIQKTPVKTEPFDGK